MRTDSGRWRALMAEIRHSSRLEFCLDIGGLVEGRSSATARRRASDYIRYDQWYSSHGNTYDQNKIKTCRSRFLGGLGF